MSTHVVLTKSEGVLEIRWNRPEKKNALTREMYDAAAAAFTAADADPTIRAVLLTGTGDAFTSGNDIGDFRARSQGTGQTSANQFLPAIAGLAKPLIGAVNGMAIGIGTTMLMHCDLIVAARSARFHMPFTSLGLVPEAGSSLLVPASIGLRRASALLLLGESLDAATAADWGLINQVVDDADLMPSARTLAARIAALPPAALRETKALLRRGKPDLAARMAEELEVFRQRVTSDEAKEAFAAFAEKRKPDFSRFS